MIDWTQKRPEQTGVVVEGKDDQVVLEAFLSAGEALGLWGSWEAKLFIIGAGGFNKLIEELKNVEQRGNVVGIADQEWRTEKEIEETQNTYAQLRFLPRRMIDNFFIDPDELRRLIPNNRHDSQAFQAAMIAIENARLAWIAHGALSHTMQNHGAHDFCRGEEGFPKRLLNKPETDQRVINEILQEWHAQLEPPAILGEYAVTTQEFGNQTREAQYRQCIDGKRFFEAVVHKQLNSAFRQQDRNSWISDLFNSQTPSFCPDDLQPLLQQLMAV